MKTEITQTLGSFFLLATSVPDGIVNAAVRPGPGEITNASSFITTNLEKKINDSSCFLITVY